MTPTHRPPSWPGPIAGLFAWLLFAALVFLCYVVVIALRALVEGLALHL